MALKIDSPKTEKKSVNNKGPRITTLPNVSLDDSDDCQTSVGRLVQSSGNPHTIPPVAQAHGSELLSPKGDYELDF